MISRKKENILLLEDCFNHIKQNKLESSGYTLISPTPIFCDVVSFFYKHYSRPSNMRSRPWALGNTLARLRGRSFAFHGKVETPNAFWVFRRNGQSPMEISIETKREGYSCYPYMGYHVSARVLADLDRVIPKIEAFLKEIERYNEKERLIAAIEQIKRESLLIP